MGQSLPPQAAIDLVSSYARRRGDDVELVLRDPSDDITGEQLALTLRRTRGDRTRRVRGTCELVAGADRRLVARAPRAELSDGIWDIILREGEGRRRVGARLLVQGERPVVLLWGAQSTESRLPEPHPRPRSAAIEQSAEHGPGARLGVALPRLRPLAGSVVRRLRAVRR
ncbi:hypothetical protein [Nocardioides pacificus]